MKRGTVAAIVCVISYAALVGIGLLIREHAGNVLRGWDRVKLKVREFDGVACTSESDPCTSWNATIFNPKRASWTSWSKGCDNCPDITGDQIVIAYIKKIHPFNIRNTSGKTNKSSDGLAIALALSPMIGSAVILVISYVKYRCKNREPRAPEMCQVRVH